MEAGHNQLTSIVERVNRLMDDKKVVGDDIKDVLAEAKGNGYNPKAIQKIVRDMRADKKAAAELQADVDAYKVTLGMAD